MKFKFKEITSALAIACFCVALTAVIAMDCNSKKVPSQADTSVSLKDFDVTVDNVDNGDITVEEETVDKVTSSVPEEQEWQNYLMAQVEIGLNIRAEANAEAEVVGSLRKGDRATIIEYGSEWTKIRSGEVVGYVNNAFCLFGVDALNWAKSICESFATGKVESLPIYGAMNSESEIAGTLEQGDTLVVDATAVTGREWVAVLFNDTLCYVRAEDVNVIRNVGEAIKMDELYAIESEKIAEEKRKQEEERRKQALIQAEKNKQNAAKSAELDLLAALIYCEAGGEPYETQLGVGAVVMNRLKKGIYGKTVAEVIYQPQQFTPACNGKVNVALNNKLATESCYRAARAALAGQDNTNGALYFNTWCEELDGVGMSFGDVIFYYYWIPH